MHMHMRADDIAAYLKQPQRGQRGRVRLGRDPC